MCMCMQQAHTKDRKASSMVGVVNLKQSVKEVRQLMRLQLIDCRVRSEGGEVGEG